MQTEEQAKLAMSDSKYKKRWQLDYVDVNSRDISSYLEYGWEPFAVSQGFIYFRRQADPMDLLEQEDFAGGKADERLDHRGRP